MWVEVPILCNTDESSAIKDLGIEVSGDLLASRKATLNTNNIVGFYESQSPNETIIAYNDTDITCLLPYEEVRKLIVKS